MTEYDFSPEAYQHYMDKMHSISRWAVETEHYRPEYENAAALTEGERNRGRSSPPARERSRRRAPPPPPLPLPPLGHDYGDYGMHSAHPSPAGFDFPYAHGPGSPGPMPPHMYYPGAPQISLISPPISPMIPMPSYRPSRDHHHHSSRHSSRRGRSRSRGPSRSSSVSYGPGSVIYAPPVSAPAYSGGYYISPPPSRHGHHPQYSVPVIYV